MLQTLIVGLIFLAAVVYLGRLVFKNFQAKSSCNTGCGKCGAVDFGKLEKQLKQNGF